MPTPDWQALPHARKIVSTLASTGTPFYFEHLPEAIRGDLFVANKENPCILISNSSKISEMIDLIDPLSGMSTKMGSADGRGRSAAGSAKRIRELLWGYCRHHFGNAGFGDWRFAGGCVGGTAQRSIETDPYLHPGGELDSGIACSVAISSHRTVGRDRLAVAALASMNESKVCALVAMGDDCGPLGPLRIRDCHCGAVA